MSPPQTLSSRRLSGTGRARVQAGGIGLLLAAALSLAAAPARAQSARYPAEPHDIDEESEQRSSFWERALHPARDQYENRTTRALRLIEARDPSLWAEAEELLQAAIADEPDLPFGHWLMGQLYEQAGRWRDCTTAYGRAAAVGAAHGGSALPFEPTASRRPGYAVDYALGTCQSRAGDFDDAAATFQRIVRRGVDNFEVRLRLGECYMALGRLDDAIDALQRAEADNYSQAAVHYALAVAYDRDGRAAESSEELENALRLDGGMGQVQSPRISYAPAEDLHYYVGLAAEGSDRPELALLHFRRYLALAPRSPWRRRAEAHLAALRKVPLSERAVITGTEAGDVKKTAALLAAAGDDFQECVRKVPGLLLSVRITELTAPGARDKVATFSSRPDAGVKAVVTGIFDTTETDTAEVVQCVERVATGIRLPPPKKSGYLTTIFPVILQ